MIRPKNRGLSYFRRSTDKQEISLPRQMEWAISAAQQHGVAFDAALDGDADCAVHSGEDVGVGHLSLLGLPTGGSWSRG